MAAADVSRRGTLEGVVAVAAADVSRNASNGLSAGAGMTSTTRTWKWAKVKPLIGVSRLESRLLCVEHTHTHNYTHTRTHRAWRPRRRLRR